ncbi:hypothetical protein OHB07_04660 [Streptomyces sp. NBC_00111]
MATLSVEANSIGLYTIGTDRCQAMDNSGKVPSIAFDLRSKMPGM